MESAERQRGESLAGNTDTSFLKALALVFMLIDHMGVVIFPGVTEMRVIGRMALPLYAWCLVVGSVKTHDPLKYGLRLLALALLSQPLYMMALNHGWDDLSILFMLLISLMAIEGIRQRFYFSQIWAPVLCYMLLGVLKVDYGWRGMTFVLLLYLARESKGGLIATYLGYALFWGASSTRLTSLFGIPLSFSGWVGLNNVLAAFFMMQGMIWLALPLIALKTNTGLRLPQWLGYALYPLHLVALILMRLFIVGDSFVDLLAGF